MNALQKFLEAKGIKNKADKSKDDRGKLIADIGKATTIAQLKAEMIKLVQMLDK